MMEAYIESEESEPVERAGAMIAMGLFVLARSVEDTFGINGAVPSALGRIARAVERGPRP
jgi:hypothetical protein